MGFWISIGQLIYFQHLNVNLFLHIKLYGVYFPLADIFQGDGRVWRVVSVGSRESVMETFWRLGVGLVVHPGQVCMAGLGSCCVDSAHYISTNWLALCTLLIKLAATGRLCLESSTNVHIGKTFRTMPKAETDSRFSAFETDVRSFECFQYFNIDKYLFHLVLIDPIAIDIDGLRSHVFWIISSDEWVDKYIYIYYVDKHRQWMWKELWFLYFWEKNTSPRPA